MTNIIGMDPDAVEQLSRDLHNQAEAINGVVSKIDGLVNHMQGIWKGHDSDQFAGWWRDQHRKALNAAHEAIEGLSTSARNNASEQRQVSAR